ncbi:MAG: alpha/beta fold hydrolase [Clostridia bacterium]|nr:alpha/beta fold hydrolase [Clostridia bacterium]
MDIHHENARPFFLEGGEHAVLLTHGFTGTPAHMCPLGEYLHVQGFTVRGILLPGHGESIEAMKKASWEQWWQAERDAVFALKKRYKRVSVMGLSMGGVLTLMAAEHEELGVTACVPISAPMKTKNKFTHFARPMSVFVPELKWGGSPDARNGLMKEYDIGYDGFATARVWDLDRLMKMARRDLFSITCPILAVQSHADETISADSANIILGGAQSRIKRMLWLDDVPHVCTISKEMEHIGREAAAFLRAAENA